MEKVKSIQERLEKVASVELDRRIQTLRKAIRDSGLEESLNNVRIFVKKKDVDGQFEGRKLGDFITYSDAVKQQANLTLLPKLINEEVSRFITRVEDLSSQMEDLQNTVNYLDRS